MLTDILLRIRSNPPLSTKGSHLSKEEVDDNFIAIYNALRIILNTSFHAAYDPTTTYNLDDLAVVDGIIYISLSDSNTGNNPTDIVSPQMWAPADESLYYSAPVNTSKYGIEAYNGGGAANATLLDWTFCRIDTAANDNDSVIINIGCIKNNCITIQNWSSKAVDIYPNAGVFFNIDGTPLAVDEKFTIESGNQLSLICYKNGEWSNK